MPIFEGYTIKKLLYKGKRHAIYEGIENSSGLNIIIKQPINEYPSQSEISNMQHEYNILKSLDIPGVITALSIVNEHQQCALILDYFAGISLSQYLKENTLSIDEFLKIALQISNIISKLHIKNIIHKDLNPANILIKPETLQIKLIDFDISSVLTQEFQDYTAIKDLEGTLSYISPEQTGRMNRLLDYRTDIYSLGVTFYEMLTKELPFIANNPFELVHSFLAIAPRTIQSIRSEIPSALSAIINKMMAKMPEERYSSASGIYNDLLNCQTQWDKNQKIIPFELGSKDISYHLTVSQKLYGRDEQITKLLAAFERVSAGKNELFLIHGFSGIGKTSLVKEIYKPITNMKGFFINGKYDQLQKSTPYSAFIAAFTILIKKQLMQSQIELDILREKLQMAVGNEGRVIAEVIPDILFILGEQPPVPDLPAKEAQNRFMSTFQKVISIFATKNSPLVIFLDDMQWIDTASLNMMKTLLRADALSNLLIIGTYRENEVLADHPLLQVIHELQKNSIKVTDILLPPMTEADIQQLLADTLHCRIEATASLAKILVAKTEGNPFFTNELLRKLYQDKLLQFSQETYQWQWDIEKINQVSVTNNVVELLTYRIQQIPEEPLRLLKLAACIGHTFDLKTLTIISESSLTTTAKNLWELVEDNLFFPLNNNYRLASFSLEAIEEQQISYRFIHDRIQQCAYQLIDLASRKQTHLTIGRLLLKERGITDNDESLFELTNHFNHALALITLPTERSDIIKANSKAGKRAKLSSAYQAALTYFESAISLLDKDAWQSNYRQAFELHKEQAECNYLIGQHELAENMFQSLILQARNLEDKANIYQKYLLMLSANNRKQEVITIGLEALNSLGLSIPKKVSLWHIYKVFAEIKWQVGFRDIETLPLKPAVNPIIKLIDKVALPIFTSVVMLDYNLYVYLNCQRIKLSLKHGYISTTMTAYLAFAMHLIHLYHREKEGFAFVRFCEKIKLRSPEIFKDFSGEYYTRGYYITYLKEPLRKSCDELMRAYQLGLEQGELQFTSFSIMGYSTYMLHTGKTLDDGREALKVYQAFKHRFKTKEYDEYLLNLQLFIRVLSDKKSAALPNATQLKSDLSQYKTKFETALTYLLYVQIYSIFGDAQNALETYAHYLPFMRYTRANFGGKQVTFYAALATAAAIHKAQPEQRRQLIVQLKKLYRELKMTAKLYPTNFLFFERLIAAEIASIADDVSQAMKLYEDAILIAKTTDHVLGGAIANERASMFYHAMDNVFIAKNYMQQAMNLYIQWGAKAKAEQLVEIHSSWFQSNTDIFSLQNFQPSTTATLASFNVTSIFKSMQVISSEIQLKNLLEQLLSILLENAGAQRVCLLSKYDNDWFIEAEGTLAKKSIFSSLKLRADDSDSLPLSLIHFSQRTQELVLVQSKEEMENKYTQEPYLNLAKPRSLLVLPILYQGQLRYIFYFENKDLEQGFLAEHVNTLQLLASQAAISLENAKLYHQATHDYLTGLSNRNLLFHLFRSAAKQAEITKNDLAILFIDLDGFKKINDSLGHEAGDHLLLHLSDILKSVIRDADVAARLGGDEFIIMMTGVKDEIEVAELATRIIKSLETPIQLANKEVFISVSIGISMYKNNGQNIQTLINQADQALYQVKAAGKNHYQFYNPMMIEKIEKENLLEADLFRAIDNKEFLLHYQPIYTSNRSLSHFEALLRWNHPQLGLVEANRFITVAEKNRLILPIGEWVLRTACEQIKKWQNDRLIAIPIAVNISGLQFKEQRVSPFIANLLKSTGIEPRYLELEFTESVFIEQNPKLIDDIESLSKLGVKLTLDDFGTHYASFNYLRRFCLDKIKIDQSFTKNIFYNENDRTITRAIIEMAHSLALKVVAEGIETQEQIDILTLQNVDELQGYFFGYPMPETNARQLLTTASSNTDTYNPLN